MEQRVFFMAGAAATIHKPVNYEQENHADEVLLTEVDHLNRFRHTDGSHDALALEGVLNNLVPAVKEAAMPYAVSTTHQEYRDGTYWWLDQTPEDVAYSGYRFHIDPAAHQRIEVEIDEAQSLVDLQPGRMKVFISPRMSQADAPYAIAQKEHLADDDMLRIHMIDTDEAGQIRGKFMQSLLVRDIPLSAWVQMLRDPENIFGTTIPVDDDGSALSVMKVHRQLEVPEASMPEGVISLVEAVLPYMDVQTQQKVRRQLALFRSGQTELHSQANNIAERWLAFEVDLADSLQSGFASNGMQEFIRSLAFQWSEAFAAEILDHTEDDGQIRMTRALAAKLEASKRNILWVAGGVLTSNERILSQLDPQVAQQIFLNEQRLQLMVYGGWTIADIQRFEFENGQVIAGQNIHAGGGCPGEINGLFAAREAEATETEWHGGKIHHNKKCQSCKKVKLEVGACHICRDCVNNPRKMKQAYDEERKLPLSQSIFEYDEEKPEQPIDEMHREVRDLKQEAAQSIQQKGRLALAGAYNE
jgi:hypothetical protein